MTPGAVNPAVTQFTIATTICSPGWAHSVRPPRKYMSYLKRRQLRALAWPDQSMLDYEEDHLIRWSWAAHRLIAEICGQNRGIRQMAGRRSRRII